MDEQGRLYVPQAVREALGIDGEATTVEITVRTDNDET
jgi:bifunctional DNA-binding transcriptional regulator/antitoxin component of YhaV-PrlF toxin-antitoxin module